jgi:hypothetical protein
MTRTIQSVLKNEPPGFSERALMPTAEATIQTGRASRYLIQLCRHADQMRRIRHRTSGSGDEQSPAVVERIDFSDTVGVVRFADGVLRLRASGDVLTLRIEAADEDSLHRLQNGIGRRLRTIGRRDGLTLTWRHVETPAEPAKVGGPDQEPEPQPATRKFRWRSRLAAIAVIAAGALIVALHLGLGGAALAASAWAGWIGNIVVAVIVGTVVVIGVHVTAGRFAYRGGKVIHAGWKQRRPSSGTTSPHDPTHDHTTNGEPT